MDSSMGGFRVLHYLLNLAQTHVHWVDDAIQPLIFCHSLLLLPSIFPRIRVFPNESALCIRWPKYCSFSFSIGPSNNYLRLVSFRIDLFDLLTVQGTLKSLLHHYTLKTSILWHSALTFVHDYWKSHSFDYMDLCWQRIQQLDHMVVLFLVL